MMDGIQNAREEESKYDGAAAVFVHGGNKIDQGMQGIFFSANFSDLIQGFLRDIRRVKFSQQEMPADLGDSAFFEKV